MARVFKTPVVLPAGGTSAPSLRLPHGAAPSAPTDGDVWTTTSGLFVRVNAATKTVADLETAQTFTGTKTFATSGIKVGQTTLAQGVNGTITFPASAGTLALNNQTFYIGTTSVAINRSSAALTLAGITLTDGVLNNIVASATSTAADLWSEITTGSITLGAGLTTGGLALATSGTGATPITIGHTNATIGITGNTTITGTLNPTNAADTATAASHYFVETGSDGLIRPKTLANVKTEIVTTAAVNSAAATTVGTVTSGTWNAGLIPGQYGGTGVANTGKTITISGNTTIGSSTHTVALATSGNTSVTLPTSGILEVTGHTHAAYATDSLVVHLAGTETITGEKTFSSQFMYHSTGAVTGRLVFSRSAGYQHGFKFRTGGSDRWDIFISSDAESGSSAGSDLKISRYSDAGGWLGDPWVLSRATGEMYARESLSVLPNASTNIALKVLGASGQTADLQQWQDSSGTPLVSIGATGQVLIGSPTGPNPDSSLHIKKRMQIDSDGSASPGVWFGNSTSGTENFIGCTGVDGTSSPLGMWVDGAWRLITSETGMTTLESTGTTNKAPLVVKNADPESVDMYLISGHTGDNWSHNIVFSGTDGNNDALVSVSAGGQMGLWTGQGTVVERVRINANGAAVTGTVYGSSPTGFRNFIKNPAMRINQRGSTYTTDDTYGLDQWILLHEGTTTMGTAKPGATGIADCMTLTVSTTNSKFGTVQILESVDCTPIIGQQVTLSFYAKVSNATNLSDIRAAIVAWSGTTDSPTSDIVSTWNAAATNPTLATSWTYENTPANLSVTTSWARYSITATIDTASTANVGVFIWNDDKTTVNADVLSITGVQLELGPVATPLEYRPYQIDLAQCQRYYWLAVSGTGKTIGNAVNFNGSNLYTHLRPPVTMRVRPSLVSTTGTNYYILYGYSGGSGNFNGFSLSSSESTADNVEIIANTTGITQHALLLRTNNASASIALSAEL